MNAPVSISSSATERLIRNAAKINKAFASGLRPPPRISVDEWAAKFRRFPDDSAYPGPWKHETAIYLVEIMQALSPFDPTPVVSIIKCAQSGGSASGENWLGYIADVAPGPTMYVGPTISAAKDWLAEKLWPMIEATPKLNPSKDGAVMPKRQKDGEGTTALRVKFKRGSWLLIAGANSAATLRQHSIKNVIEDDLDQFPNDLDKQGSPEKMVDARQRVYARQGISKRLKISTPTNKGASKIEAADLKSDQCRFHFKCQQCGSRFEPKFEDLDWPKSPVEKPEQAYLVAPCCDAVHRHWQKEAMSLVDGWCSTVEVDGKKPPRHMTEEEFQVWRARKTGIVNKGFSIPGIISTFLTWGQLAAGWVDARGDVNKLRSWTNLENGEAFILKGDAPPAEELELLKEQDWGRGQAPWGPTILTLGCDVQGDGIYFLKVGWFHGLESWVLDHGFLPGATDVAGAGAWALLEDYVKSTVTMPGGKAQGLDMICVDAGYNTEAAKAFCKRSPIRLPVFGRPGWTQPILGRGMAIHFDRYKPRKGKVKKKAGEEAHLVGTFGAKLSFYGNLKASIKYVKAQIEGNRPDPIRGRVHFGRDATPDLFDMLTSESCVVEIKNGLPARVWKPEPGRENHWLDCMIYNRAAAEALALDSRSENDWLVKQGERYAAKDEVQGDLVALANQPLRTEPVASERPSGAVDISKFINGSTGENKPWIEPVKDWIGNART